LGTRTKAGEPVAAPGSTLPPKIKRRLFCFWTGDNEMSDTRKACLESLTNTGLEVTLITPANLKEWIVPGHPLPAAYPYLSAVHRSDYLRAYMMHNYGGGYADLKMNTEDWTACVDRLDNAPEALGIGYTEKSAKGVAHIHRHQLHGKHYRGREPVSALKAFAGYRWLRLNWRSLIGSCAYVLRPQTTLTREWLGTIEARLAAAETALQTNPATDPRAKADPSDDSGYPLPWSFICADIFHPLVYQNRARILHGLPMPSFKNYQ